MAGKTRSLHEFFSSSGSGRPKKECDTTNVVDSDTDTIVTPVPNAVQIQQVQLPLLYVLYQVILRQLHILLKCNHF